MPDSWLLSLQKLTRKFFLAKKCKRKKPNRLISDLSWLASSFAAMEVSSQLKQVFKFFDANGDGKISPLELSEVLLSLGHEKSMAGKEAQGMVREMDCDGDGFVDLDEFMNVMAETDHEVLMDAFCIFDTDNNGFISAEELHRVLSSLGCDNCSLSECRRMVHGVDKNGDGFVDFEEFKLMMA